MMRTRHSAEDLGPVCSADCELDDQDLVIARLSAQYARQVDPDWGEFEREVEAVLAGEFRRPYRPHHVFR